MMNLNVLLGIIGPGQIVLIVIILLVLFGGRKIPELMRGIGQGMKEFKNATKNEEESEEDKEKKELRDENKEDSTSEKNN